MAEPIPRKVIEASLLEKGFIEDNRDHRVYVLYHKGKKTKSRTKISTGSNYKDYPEELLSKMKRQLLLQTNKEVRDLLTCTMSKDDYIRLLISHECIEP